MSQTKRRDTVKRENQLLEIFYRLCRNRTAMLGFAILMIVVFCALFPELVAPYGYDDQMLSRKFQAPSAEHWFGTDNLGRDIFSRVVYGAQISLRVGVLAVLLAALFGTVLGSIAGFYGSFIENTIMRVMDIMLAIPSILLAISIVAALGAGISNLILAIGIGLTPGFARIVRAPILSVKEQEFVEAARSIGAGNLRIVLRHVLPNCLAPIIVQITMGVASAILSAASLSFIGLGIQPPQPEWGTMLSAGRQFIRDYWHVVAFPGLAIMITILSLNLFGDGLRDALDPKLKS